MNEKITYRPSQVPRVLVKILSDMKNVQDVVLDQSFNKVTFKINYIARSIEVAPNSKKDAVLIQSKAVDWYASDVVLIISNEKQVTEDDLYDEVLRIVDILHDDDMYRLLTKYIVSKGAPAIFETPYYDGGRNVLKLCLNDYGTDTDLGELIVYVVPVSPQSFKDPSSGHVPVARWHHELIIFCVNASAKFIIEHKDWTNIITQEILRLESTRRDDLEKYNKPKDETE